MPGNQQRMMGPPMGYNNRVPDGRYEAELDPEQHNKLFIGGLSFETNEQSLKTYFSKWGEIKDVIVMRDSSTKRSRGFGFIKYKTKESVDDVQKARPHKIDDRDVETKRAMPRDDPHMLQQQSVKKMFVGGLKEDTKEDQVRDCFSEYGEIELIEMIQDKGTGKTKGFCFVTFNDYDPVDKLVLKRKVELNGKKVELKKAFAKGELAAQGRLNMQMGMPMGRGGRGDFGYGQGYPGGYGGYGGPGYGPNFNGNGMYGGYNDFGNYGHPQGNQRGYGGNNYGNNYGSGFNRR